MIFGMARVLITYFSRTGNTEKMAKLVAEGAREVKGVEIELKRVEELSPDDLLAYDGIVIGSPVYYGTMAAAVKELLDRSVKHHGKLEGKVGGAFASSGGPGGGNETTVLDILKAMLIHGMVIKGDPEGDHYGPIAVEAPDRRSAGECRKRGRSVAELAKRLFG
jgi:NAD(P)H dehydrogenase (quinone)